MKIAVLSGRLGVGLALAAALLTGTTTTRSTAAEPAPTEIRWEESIQLKTPQPTRQTPATPKSDFSLQQLLFVAKEDRKRRQPGWFAKSKRRYNRGFHRKQLNGRR